MASLRILSVSRAIFSSTGKRTLPSFLLHRSLTSSSTVAKSSPVSLSSFSLLSLRSLASVGFAHISPAVGGIRTFATRLSQTSLSDNSPNWSNRPPKETILLDGCDFEHWLVVTEPPPENATRDEIIDSYIKTLAQVVGSEEEARMKIYSVSTRCYYAFGALVSEELSYKLKELPNVRWVLPDSYLDVKNKDYGGEPFINGQAVPYDPKYHEEWIRNNQKAQERNRRNDRPRNADRSRNFERRQRASGLQNNPNPGPNMGGPGVNPGSPSNVGGMPNQPGAANPGYGQNMSQNNPSYGQNMPLNNTGYGQNVPQNNPRYGQNMQQNNMSYGQNGPGFPQVPNRGGMPSNYGGHGNPGFQGNMPNHQGAGMTYNNAQMPPVPPGNYASQENMGGQPRGHFQGQDMPGRDVPHHQ
uniref:MORF/ORRM1/DAG-like MORF domain-containing protein n=1 Tax=Opuntia streptacantha TaxID=393608 RepID=A0A7C9DWB6_OPUST